ncbi:uncharacterized protein LOC105164092 [Sesamum indicum]|uniref:Uncharacterized protein LOC105164092 n=1 Tax=Sesamum indicum TaxID=4182 RepID=A0A6I9TBG8_SESIN|nr:uncharacterized protein LOC105164092 [Sesamum indicum]
MTGKGGKKKGPNAGAGSQPRVSMTLREESTGKKQGSVNFKSMCKLDHMKNLAVWAAAEASIPSLGAFFGERLAAASEALGIRSDPSLFVCERCESILQPGDNCTVRIEKNMSKSRCRRKKSSLTTQNNVVYRCHFCSHRNVMRGTPKGYVKEICPPNAKPPLKIESAISAVEKCASSAITTKSIVKVNKVDTVALPTIDEQNLETSSPATPLPTTALSLLDSKRRKRTRSGVKKAAAPETISTAADAEKSINASSKRRKKSWTSLKEIAESSEHEISKKKLTNSTIPFFI